MMLKEQEKMESAKMEVLKVLAQKGINVDASYVDSTLTEVAEENQLAEAGD